MDRNVVTATVLIALIMVVWLVWLAPAPVVPDAGAPTDSLQTEEESFQEPQAVEAPERVGTVPQLAGDDSTFAASSNEPLRRITVETDLYTAELSTQGGTFTSFRLKDFTVSETDRLVELVDSTKGGSLAAVFTTPGSRIYDSRSFRFETDVTGNTVTALDAPATLSFMSKLGDGELRFTYTFTPGTYEVGLDVDMENAASFATQEGYELMWNGGVPFSEKDIETSAQRSGAYARSGGTVESVQLFSDPFGEKTLNGQVDWVAAKNKYFTVVLIPTGPTRGAELIGERFGDISQSYLRHDYVAGLRMPSVDAESQNFRMYMGPMELSRIRTYDLDLYDMVDYGWDFFEVVTRPLAKFIFIPVFDFMARFVPNYGLVIILFSILIKLILSPLTKSSFRSMAKMRELQPRMEVIKEKHANDPQKQQQAMMKMYKETGVNPLGGCLPMLLQYPIIIALWQFLPQAIEIRQQGFLWAADLSAPDSILQLPFSIPFYGDFVGGFTLLMGISMVVQMKMQMTSTVSNAQAKIFTYVFPIMLFVIFNKLAAGLSLYYLCYNVLTAAQQKLINKQIAAEGIGASADKEEDDRVVVKGRGKRSPSAGKKKK